MHPAAPSSPDTQPLTPCSLCRCGGQQTSKDVSTTTATAAAASAIELDNEGADVATAASTTLGQTSKDVSTAAAAATSATVGTSAASTTAAAGAAQSPPQASSVSSSSKTRTSKARQPTEQWQEGARRKRRRPSQPRARRRRPRQPRRHRYRHHRAPYINGCFLASERGLHFMVVKGSHVVCLAAALSLPAALYSPPQPPRCQRCNVTDMVLVGSCRTSMLRLAHTFVAHAEDSGTVTEASKRLAKAKSVLPEGVEPIASDLMRQFWW